MRSELRNTLEGYVHHAEHYGVEEVFETALDGGLGLRDLGRLALRLQNLDPRWKLTPEAQRLFALALVQNGKSDRDAARMVGCRPATVRGWLLDDAQYDDDGQELGPDLALRRASADRFEHLRPIVRDPGKRP